MYHRLSNPVLKRVFYPFFTTLFTVLLAACGGGGGGGSTPTPPPPPPPDLAPASIAGKTFLIADPDQPQIRRSFVFDAATFTSASGDSGSYTYAKTAGSTTQARLQITSAFSPVLTYQLTFTSTTGGTYVDQSSKSGTFTY